MLLAHERIEGGSGRLVVFLHGILGSRGNWRSFARKLAEARPGDAMLLADLRCHGQSHGFLPPHTVEACARDVAALVATVPHERLVIVGHSYGGKVALELARTRPVDTAWILDAPPGIRTFDRGFEEIDRVLEAVRAAPIEAMKTRQELVRALQARGLSERLGLWMTTNLEPRAGGGFSWRFELDAIPELLASFAALDLWPFVFDAARGARLVMVRGASSDRWAPSELTRLEEAARAGRVEAHVLEGAGHWLHTDRPEALLSLMSGAG